MHSRLVGSQDDVKAVHDEIVRLLHAGNPEGALALVDSLVATEGHDFSVKQLQAIALTEGGADLGRRNLVERGAELWRQLGAEDKPGIDYNLANAELAIWELAVRSDGLAVAWERDSYHLRTARKHYLAAGRDDSRPLDARLKALTNAANSYDVVGRSTTSSLRAQSR